MDPLLLVYALSLLALVAVTIGIALMVQRRRARERRELREREEAGLRGLIRTSAEDEERRKAR